MTTLNLPNEIINKIFSYIEGKHNQIIKTELINTNTFWSDRDTSIYNIVYAFNVIKRNLLRNKIASNNKVIKYNKYFKYTALHRDRQYLFDDITFRLRYLIDEFNYYNDYINYTKILKQVRTNYIYDYSGKYELTNRQLRKYYNVYFKYTILHENRKKVCNHIRRYNKKHNIFDKKLSNNILLERGILINYIKQDNNKRQKKWH
jgi:hypothetical protein